MKILSKGMEAQGVPSNIQIVLDGHREVLVIVSDPDDKPEGESTVAVYSKLLDSKGVITPMLSNILQSLLVTTNGKQCSSIAGQSPIGA